MSLHDVYFLQKYTYLYVSHLFWSLGSIVNIFS